MTKLRHASQQPFLKYFRLALSFLKSSLHLVVLDACVWFFHWRYQATSCLLLARGKACNRTLCVDTKRKPTSYVAVETLQINHETIHRPPFWLNMRRRSNFQLYWCRLARSMLLYWDFERCRSWLLSAVVLDYIHVQLFRVELNFVGFLLVYGLMAEMYAAVLEIYSVDSCSDLGKHS